MIVKKKIYFLSMKVDYPPFGGHKTKHLKHYNSQVIMVKSNYMIWFKSKVKRLIIIAQS